MKSTTLYGAVLLLSTSTHASQNFTVSNGQIFTPGFVVVDAPQPGTPLGGQTLHIALDVTANGRLPQPPYNPKSPSLIHNITIFLSSYTTSRNLSVLNTAEAPSGNIIDQEVGSTVKHVNWLWPDCLVGDGKPTGDNSDRGSYNISIRQFFRLNEVDHYTVFDLPISVTNRIPKASSRPSCDGVDNPLLPPDEITSDPNIGILFAPGDSTIVTTSDKTKQGNGLGKPKQEASPEDGLRSTASQRKPQIPSLLGSAILLSLDVLGEGFLR